MAVRVLIEREVEQGQEIHVHDILMKLRGKAMQVKGYISGETLRSQEDPRKLLVISTWNSADDWKAWESNPDRRQAQEELNRLLRHPEKAAVYIYL
jgi:heme oxygenase (mycobilin-producing)